jgi:hypothetical protein
VRASSRLFGYGVRYATDFCQPGSQRELVETADRQRDKYADALVQHAVRILEGERDFCR